VVTSWPGSTHDTRILNHALANFGDKFSKPPVVRNANFVYTLVLFEV
jgi:hypothetical protein